MKNFSLSITFLCISFFCHAQTYFVNQIAYNPLPFDSGIQVVTPFDDAYGDTIGLGFDFYFFGQAYQSVVIGTNGVIGFNLNNANGICGWQITGTIPTTLPPADIRNSIMLPWQDV